MTSELPRRIPKKSLFPLASRLESTCRPGMIQVSYRVYSHTRALFPYEALTERMFKGFSRPLRSACIGTLRRSMRARPSSPAKIRVTIMIVMVVGILRRNFT